MRALVCGHSVDLQNLHQDSLCESSESGRFEHALFSSESNFVSHKCIYSDVAGKVSETFDAVLRALK